MVMWKVRQTTVGFGLLLGCALPRLASAIDIDQVAESARALNQAEIQRRDILSTATALQMRVRKIAQEKGKLTEELFQTEDAIRTIAKQMEDLEKRRAVLKSAILRRLRSLYKLQVDRILLSVLSAKNSFELDFVIRGLKLVSEQDYRLISEYRKSSGDLARQRSSLDRSVKRLLRIENRLKKQEQLLIAERKNKMEIASQVESLISVHKRHLAELKSSARQSLDMESGVQSEDELNKLRELLKPGLFELKGRLKWPVPRAVVVTPFGVLNDESEGIRLNHKGLTFSSEHPATVQSVADGRVVFKGGLNGAKAATLIVDHGDHYYSVFKGSVRFNVQIDQLVKAGDALGPVPARESVYFELRHFSEAQNPLIWLEAQSPSADRSLVRGY